MSSVSTEHAVSVLLERYLEVIPEPKTEWVEEWDAKIYQQRIGEEQVIWRPVKRDEVQDFSTLESALDMRFHDSVKRLFGDWFSGDLSLAFATGETTPSMGFELLMPQCQEDAERLLQNLTGHILMKRKLKQPVTIFIGILHEHDDCLVSIDNSTGEVALEWLGKLQHQTLAVDLATFLLQCQPHSGEND
ncbi:MAG TPA: SecY-interacting protein Syd [Idiomarina baltica]|uniref:SecY-interacting protein Syd n=1 Tax=Idiomarina baltica TaxID=190892 RepID=A0A348WR98_9GAMM|nr:SecY-interacting protein Syd [Idiomarina sp.]HAR57060.1 SecY-interacting protein Syd [Idiomarina baltica]